MIILTLRTDKPEAEIGLFDNAKKQAYQTWHAHRELAETLPTKVRELLEGEELEWQNIEAIIIYKGPGSFTGLRIGISFANALAWSQGVPIVGTTDDTWCEDGIRSVTSGKNEMQVLPEYGAEPHITQQKK